MIVTVCKNCQCRISGELWHGPHCKCRKPDFVAVDTRFSIIARREGRSRQRGEEVREGYVVDIVVHREKEVIDTTFYEGNEQSLLSLVQALVEHGNGGAVADPIVGIFIRPIRPGVQDLVSARMPYLLPCTECGGRGPHTGPGHDYKFPE